jgi:hypothetical protein
MALRGRHWFTLWLAAACGALWLVVWRQTDSLRTARRLEEVRQQRTVLEGHRSEFERRMRAASDPAVLAKRVGLRRAADSELFYLAPPDSDSTRR